MPKSIHDFWCAHYELQLKDFPHSAPRRGALVRINGGIADLHPWPELGDLPIEEEIEALKNKVPTGLGEKTLFFAEVDLAAREKGVNLLQGLPVAENHLHLGRPAADLDLNSLKIEIEKNGFRRVKLKVSDFLSPLEFGTFKKLVRLSGEMPDLKIRLDFNYAFGDRAHDFEDLLNTFTQEELDAIDFIEDPFLYDEYSWIKISEKFKIRLALDRGDLELKTENDDRDDKSFAPFAVCVLKPALEEVAPIAQSAVQNMRRLCVTSYLDHPIGQLCAAYETGLLLQAHPFLLEDCGLMSHRAYEKNQFSEALNCEKNKIKGAEGIGWGFDALLSKLHWQKVL